MLPQCGIALNRMKTVLHEAGVQGAENATRDGDEEWIIEVWQAERRIVVAARVGDKTFPLETVPLAERHLPALRNTLVCTLMHNAELGDRYPTDHEAHLVLALADDVLRVLDRQDAPEWLEAELRDG